MSRHAPEEPARPSLVGGRLVLATGVLFGVATAASLAADHPAMAGVNFRVYRLAGAAALAGEPLYAATVPGFPTMGYRYPPGVALAFVPLTLLGWQVGFVLHLATSLVAGLALAGLLVGFVEARRGRLPALDRALIAAFALASSAAAPTLYFGNVNVHLALGLALALVALDQNHETAAGVALGAVAAVKVFAAAFGLWFLARRAWRAAAAAVATVAAVLAVGLLAFGVDAHVAFLTEVLLPRRRTAAFAGGLDPDAQYVTLRRPVSVLAPDLSPAAMGAVAAAALAVPVGAVVRWADGRDADLLALFAVVAGVLLALPSYPVYYHLLAVPLIPLLYLLAGPGRWPLVGGALLANATVTLDTVAPVLPAAALEILRPLLTLGTPPLYGLLCCLAGCVLAARAGRDARASPS